MKKMLLGTVFLLLIFCICMGNAIYLDTTLSDIKAALIQSIDEDEIIYDNLSLAYKSYLSVERYASIVLRESKCNNLSNTFLDAMSSPDDPMKIEIIIRELDSIRNADKISWGSVF